MLKGSTGTGIKTRDNRVKDRGLHTQGACTNYYTTLHHHFQMFIKNVLAAVFFSSKFSIAFSSSLFKHMSLF